MPLFTPEELAVLSASTVRVATLVDFMFGGSPPDGGPAYLWNGFGQRMFAGKTYIGCGDLGTIEGLEETRDSQAHQVTFTLSGVPDSPVDLLAKAIAATDIVQGNIVSVSLQLFDDNWNNISAPIAIYFGIMQQPKVTRETATPETGARRIITLPAENLFYGRARPPAGRYTDAEQQQRFPGDLFCQYTPQMVNLSIAWPDY